MPKQTGDSLDVGAIVQNINCKGVAGTVPTDMFVYPRTFNLPLDGLAATLIRRKIEDEIILFLAVILRLANK